VCPGGAIHVCGYKAATFDPAGENDEIKTMKHLPQPLLSTSQPGVDFTNILLPAFVHSDPKSARRF